MEISGAYEVKDVSTDQPKNAHNAASIRVSFVRKRGFAKSRAIRNMLPMTHAICVAAIECGAAAIINSIKTKAARSVHFTKADDASISAKASNFSTKDIA